MKTDLNEAYLLRDIKSSALDNFFDFGLHEDNAGSVRQLLESPCFYYQTNRGQHRVLVVKCDVSITIDKSLESDPGTMFQAVQFNGSKATMIFGSIEQAKFFFRHHRIDLPEELLIGKTHCCKCSMCYKNNGLPATATSKNERVAAATL